LNDRSKAPWPRMHGFTAPSVFPSDAAMKKGPEKPAQNPESLCDDFIAASRRKTVYGPELLRHVARLRLECVIDTLVRRRCLFDDLDEPVLHGFVAAVAVGNDRRVGRVECLQSYA
jgi:hypothetical protein